MSNIAKFIGWSVIGIALYLGYNTAGIAYMQAYETHKTIRQLAETYARSSPAEARGTIVREYERRAKDGTVIADSEIDITKGDDGRLAIAAAGAVRRPIPFLGKCCRLEFEFELDSARTSFLSAAEAGQ
jgi:hypothetical protein